MDSAVRKIVTFYQILDSLHSHRDLTRDSVDVALRWADFCRKFYVESKDKPFYHQLQSLVLAKLSSKSHSFTTSTCSSLDALKDSKALVVMAILRNPFVSKDLFAYALSFVPEVSELENSVLSEVSLAAGIVSSVREEEWQKLELDLVASFLIDVVLKEPADSNRRSDETRSHLLSKLNDLVNERSGHDFVVKLLLKLNSSEFLSSNIHGDVHDAVEFLTEVMTTFLLSAMSDDVLETMDSGTLDEICARESQVLKRYLAWLRGRRDADDAVKQRLISLKSVFDDLGKCSGFLKDFEC